jgi:hypothetical protein
LNLNHLVGPRTYIYMYVCATTYHVAKAIFETYLLVQEGAAAQGGGWQCR